MTPHRDPEGICAVLNVCSCPGKKIKSKVAKLADERKVFSIVKRQSSCERGILHQ